MWRLPIGYIVSVVVFFYTIYTLWTILILFSTPKCSVEETKCLFPAITHQNHDMAVFSVNGKTTPKILLEIKHFDFHQPFSKLMTLNIPYKLKNNGTMSLYIGFGPSKSVPLNWHDVQYEGIAEEIPMVTYLIPQATTFDLLGDKQPDKKNKKKNIPVAHMKSIISFSALADPILLPSSNIPHELLKYIRLNRYDQYLPIIQHNILKNRLRDLVELTKDTKSVNITLDYQPASIGKLKFLVHVSLAINSLNGLGFGEKDVDEIKEILADTNLYLLCATIIIASVHIVFDFLAFKNDISFWKAKTTMEGLSVRTVLWRAFSQTIITLYLLDENTTVLVLIPCAIGAIIELWKVKKILHIDFDWKEHRFPRIATKSNLINKAELQTRSVDAEAMQYLSYILYPLCICGAIYSLIYQPHKSWYSWTLNSIVNGVYAFGFLFMLPQLFINYKLKSVAALPWRAFMYKAFNTFIDDVFAFIITMPVAHRVACFRDDVVFIIYLYQRWLYPVDKSRIDNAYNIEETISDPHAKKNK